MKKELGSGSKEKNILICLKLLEKVLKQVKRN